MDMMGKDTIRNCIKQLRKLVRRTHFNEYKERIRGRRVIAQHCKACDALVNGMLDEYGLCAICEIASGVRYPADWDDGEEEESSPFWEGQRDKVRERTEIQRMYYPNSDDEDLSDVETEQRIP